MVRAYITFCEDTPVKPVAQLLSLHNHLALLFNCMIEKVNTKNTHKTQKKFNKYRTGQKTFPGSESDWTEDKGGWIL